MRAVIGAANRDLRQFANADRFDVTRDPNPHIAFGHGLHFCLGAALARLDARVGRHHHPSENRAYLMGRHATMLARGAG